MKIIIVTSLAMLVFTGLGQAALGASTSTVDGALSWLISHQQSNGSYGSCSESQTAPAAYALWIAYRDSSNVVSALQWLKNQMDNTTTWFWVGGGCSLPEADVPGEILYSFDVTGHVSMLNLSFVSSKLLSLQQTNGGFLGYSSSTGQTTSSVDTAMALLGLIDSGTIPSSKESSAVNYLFSLQTSGGSFNLTRTAASDPLYSLGPEPVSITALVLLALKAAGYSTTDSHVSSAMNYLTNAASTNFNGHVYAASLSALVFSYYNLPTYLSAATTYIVSQQGSDGGFRDIIRLSTGSNALDTGWATVALQQSSATVGGVTVNVDRLRLLAPCFAIGLAIVGLLVSAVLLRKNGTSSGSSSNYGKRQGDIHRQSLSNGGALRVRPGLRSRKYSTR